MNRRMMLVLIATVAAVAGLAVGLRGPRGTARLLTANVPIAHAIDCQPVNDTCGSDGTKTSLLKVDHREGTNAVTPNTSETWDVTVLYAAAANCNTYHAYENGSFTVSWNGSGWTLSNQTYDTHIYAYSICDTSFGCGSLNPAKSYKVLVDLEDHFQVGMDPQLNLRDVTYTTSSVDNGTKYTNILCTTTSAVSPTSQTWSDVDDPGDWSGRCGFNCSANNGGATVTITYQ